MKAFSEDKKDAPADILIVIILATLTAIFVLTPLLADTPISTILDMSIVLFLITPQYTGKNMNLELLLIRENNQTEPYRDLHLWVNVSEAHK